MLASRQATPITYGEFLHWLGLWFLMGTCWSTNEIGCIYIMQAIQSDPDGTCHYSKSPTGLQGLLLGGAGHAEGMEQKYGATIHTKLGELF